MSKILKTIKNPLLFFAYIWMRTSPLIKSDRLYLKILYYCYLHKSLDLDNPTTFSEKIQWLKLYDISPLYTKMVDKYEVRDLVKNIIGEEYLIPLLGVWDTVEEIDFNKLPNQFVLKCTHDSGSVVICRDKANFNIEKAKKILDKALKHNYYYKTREYPYKNVKARIIAEKFMVDNLSSCLDDYKFFCFNGKPEILFYASERFIRKIPYFDYYDMDLNHLPIESKGHENNPQQIYNLPFLKDMKSVVVKLLQNDFISPIPLVRVDLYYINGRIYFGEYTFSHDGGIVPFVPNKWNRILGDKIILPNVLTKN